MRMHDIEHGTFPESVESLQVKGIRESDLADPFSGRPFGYSREKGLLWSVGPDGETNGIDNLYYPDGRPFPRVGGLLVDEIVGEDGLR